MEEALQQLEQFAVNTDDIGRQNLRTRLRRLADSTECVITTIDRIGHRHLECAAIKVGCDLGLFRLLVATQDAVSVVELAQKTGAEADFMSRLMRYIAGLGGVDEVVKDVYLANHITNNLADDLSFPGISHYFETCGPLHQSFPGWLQKNGYKTPADASHTVFQDAFRTNLSIRPWISQAPLNMGYLVDYVKLRGPPSPSWLTVYPVEGQTTEWDASRPVFIELGGKTGHQAAQFKLKYPDVRGRVIWQDAHPSLDMAPSMPGVEKLAHSIFESPPVKGAKFYFLSRVFHNNTPQKACNLLQLLKSAMVAGSRLLIDEAVPPETNVDYLASAIDLTMLEAFAAIERTESQWRETLEDNGLELVKVHVYNPSIYESIVEVRLP
ncbi:hypothetical protein Daus18300_007736 [Diaporthe australafricana]|uniref:O-methyltransferase domain-containing protein n=1 Tax=Diaporthe australafricana TaxID=127596 RepID=A0ABR3WL62_9PEZI